MAKGMSSRSTIKGKSPKKGSKKQQNVTGNQNPITTFFQKQQSVGRDNNIQHAQNVTKTQECVNKKSVENQQDQEGVVPLLSTESKYFSSNAGISKSNSTRSSKLSLKARNLVILDTKSLYVDLSKADKVEKNNGFVKTDSEEMESKSSLKRKVTSTGNVKDELHSIQHKKCKAELNNLEECSNNETVASLGDRNFNDEENITISKQGNGCTTFSGDKKDFSSAATDSTDIVKEPLFNPHDENSVDTEPDSASNAVGYDVDETNQNDYKVPYYLENFLLIMDAVLKDDLYAALFNEEDFVFVKNFQQLSENSQKLYVRLFGRQFRWLPKRKIVYPKIAEDLSTFCEELVERGFLLNESSLHDMNDIFKTLSAPDLKTLGKSLRLNINKPRNDLIQSILKHTTQSSIGTFFKPKNSTNVKTGINQAILNRAKKLLGPCYRLCKTGRSVFMRIMLLFGLHHMQGEDDDRAGGQGQLFQMLMSNIGRVKYPDYTVCRKTKIFQGRECVKRLSNALQLEVEIADALEKKDYDAALEIYRCGKEKFEELMTDHSIVEHDASLPLFLRTYTAGAVYTRVLTHGVELHQFTKNYEQAVNQLQNLIQQEVYHLDYRGRWYDRLVLNLDHHLKKPSQALDYIKEGLKDENIRVGHRYALFQRAQKICNANSNKKLKKRWQEFSDDVMVCVQDPPKVFVKGRQLKHVAPGGFSVFISDDSLSGGNEEVTFLKRVEDVALNHYKEAGYCEGLHAEGGILSFFLTVFMWDIVYCDDIPDVFYNMYQTMPLDLYTPLFYQQRKQLFDDRLLQLKSASEQELHDLLEQSWTAHKDTLCIGGNWELFRDLDHAKGLLSCIGGSLLSAVLERMVKDLRFTRSGIPDLTVWNPQTKHFKIVEVKGPGDRLSTKQILWLDYFLCLGIKAEVCHVQAVDAKKLH